MMKINKKIFVLIIFLSVNTFFIVNAAPSSKIYFPDGEVSSEDNTLLLGGSEWIIISFLNMADTGVDDVASTIQYITLAAADLNPSRTLINSLARWEIYEPGSSTPRAGDSIGEP